MLEAEGKISMDAINRKHEHLKALYQESKLVEIVQLADSDDLMDTPELPMSQIRKRVGALYDLRTVCQTDEGWILQKDSKGVRTLNQNHPERRNIHSIRLDGVVNSPVFCLLALFHEVDLFSKWIPTYSCLGLQFGRLIDNPSPTELVVHLNIRIPWPFANRYCFFHCDGIDCMDDPTGAQIGVILSNLSSEAEYKVVDEGTKTIFHPPSGVLLTPLGDGTTKVQIVVNLDPQISFIPDWLIDIAVRNLAYLIMLQIRKAVEIVKNDPEYRKRMTDPDSAFYNHIKRRIRESMPDEAKYIPADSSDEEIREDPEFSTPNSTNT